MRATFHIPTTRLALIAQGVGYAVMLFGIFGDGQLTDDDLRATGIAILLASVIWYLNARSRPSEQAIYEAGRSAGYDDGYRDGKRVARPVVLHMNDYRQAAMAGD